MSDNVKPLVVTCAAVAVCVYMYTRAQASNEKEPQKEAGKLSKEEIRAKLAAHKVMTVHFVIIHLFSSIVHRAYAFG